VTWCKRLLTNAEMSVMLYRWCSYRGMNSEQKMKQTGYRRTKHTRCPSTLSHQRHHPADRLARAVSMARAVLCQKIGHRSLHGCTCINVEKIRGSCLTLASAALELRNPVGMLPWISRLLHFHPKSLYSIQTLSSFLA